MPEMGHLSYIYFMTNGYLGHKGQAWPPVYRDQAVPNQTDRP